MTEDKLLDPAYISGAGPITPLDILYGRRPPATHGQGRLYLAHRRGFTEKVLVGTARGGGVTVASRRRNHPYFDLYALAAKGSMPDAQVKALAVTHFA